MIFVDTSAWFSRFVPDDPAHARMSVWFAENRQPLVTSDYCVDETLTLLVARNRPKLAVEVGRLLFDESIAYLHFLTRAQISRSWILFQRHAGAGWSFTDCTSKTVIDDLNVKEAVALDEHFHQFGVTVIS